MLNVLESAFRVSMGLCVVLGLIAVACAAVWGALYLSGAVWHRLALWGHARALRRAAPSAKGGRFLS